ncbi:thioesterase domain-containing protein [Streptomyces sp. NPDC058371]|uniref:thioesterase domain-containing protein n=1 Tax=Streptomyces sp. NPDC058371 TaxID=3346463 RepID=UPI00364F00EA
MSGARFPLVLLPGPDTSVTDVARLVRTLPAALRPVVVRPAADGARTRESVRALPDLVDGLVRQVRDAGVSDPFALHGWGAGAYLGLALAGAFERAVGHAVCTTLFVSDAAAPGWVSARLDSTPSPDGLLTQAVRRTVTESRLVVCTGQASAGIPAAGLEPWCRHSTSGTEFVTLPPGFGTDPASALSRLIAARLLPAAVRAARMPVARVYEPDVAARSGP